jgi:hypothetical protein
MSRAAASGAPRTSRSAIALERNVSRANLRCAPKKVQCAADFDPKPLVNQMPGFALGLRFESRAFGTSEQFHLGTPRPASRRPARIRLLIART